MTKPHPDFINRTPSDGLQSILEHYSYYIKEAVNFGTQMLSWGNKDSKDQSAVSNLFFRQFIDILDAFSILVENGSSGSCKILLRSMFEINLFIHFISDSHTKERSYSYLVFDILDHIKELDKLDIQTDSGKQIKSKFLNEFWLNNVQTKHSTQEIQTERVRLEGLLNHSEFEIVLKEHDKIKVEMNNNSSAIKKIKWYSLFGGANNIESLAKLLKKQTLYEVLYRNWSKAVHGVDIFKDKNTLIDDEHIFIHPIREPRGLMLLSRCACNLAVNTFGYYSFINHPLKQEEYAKWQNEFIEDFSDQLDHEYVQTKIK